MNVTDSLFKSKTQNAAEQRILIFRIGNLGDTVIALPALWAIRQAFPAAQLTLLGNSIANRMIARDVLPADGLINDWLTYPTAADNRATTLSGDLLKLFFELRRRKFDALVYLAPRARSFRQRQRDLLFFRAAGIPKFIGQNGFKPVPQKNPSAPLPIVEHEADHLLERLRCSEIGTPEIGEGSLNLNLTHAEKSAALTWLAENAQPAFVEKRLVGVGAGSKWESKIWDETNFVKLGQRLISELNLFPILFGGNEDFERNERLLKIWQRGANAAGKLNIRQAAAALEQCELYVGNDTGTMHLAAAVKTRCVGIFAALDWRGRWYPYGVNHQILREFVLCEGCLLAVCPFDNLCLQKISVETVFAACRKICAENKNVIA